MQMQESAPPDDERADLSKPFLEGQPWPREHGEAPSAADRLAVEKGRQFRTRRPAVVAIVAVGLLAALAVLSTRGRPVVNDPVTTGTIEPKNEPLSYDRRRELDAAEAMGP